MRRHYLDNIRFITVLSVVLYHVFYVYNHCGVLGGIGPLGTPYADILLYVLYPWFMLLLFVVSGMSARYCLEKCTVRDFIRAKTRKLLVPSTLGLFVLWWVVGYFNIRYSGGFDIMSQIPKPALYFICALSGIGPLWYIQLLWVFSLLTVLIRKIEQNRLYAVCKKVGVPLLVLMTAVIWGAAQILNTPVITVYRFGIYGLGYFIGYFVLSHDEVTDRLKTAWLPLSIAAVCLSVWFVIADWGKNYTDDAVLQSRLCNAYAWIAVLAILAFMKRFCDFQSKATAFFAARSWGLYLFHYLPLIACAGWLYDKPLPPLVQYAATALCAYGGGYLLYAIVRRIPILRYVLCGIKTEKK